MQNATMAEIGNVSGRVFDDIRPYQDEFDGFLLRASFNDPNHPFRKSVVELARKMFGKKFYMEESFHIHVPDAYNHDCCLRDFYSLMHKDAKMHFPVDALTKDDGVCREVGHQLVPGKLYFVRIFCPTTSDVCWKDCANLYKGTKAYMVGPQGLTHIWMAQPNVLHRGRHTLSLLNEVAPSAGVHVAPGITLEAHYSLTWFNVQSLRNRFVCFYDDDSDTAEQAAARAKFYSANSE